MAKKSKIAANQRRMEVVARYRARRQELKEVIRSPHAADEQKRIALLELAKQPRDASATRVRNRDVVDGRPRAFSRKFGLSRIRLREMAHRGELPGITKSSW